MHSKIVPIDYSLSDSCITGACSMLGSPLKKSHLHFVIFAM